MTELKYGFTGTRSGLNDSQKKSIIELLQKNTNNGQIEIHHGDCVGADKDFHDLCVSLSNKINIKIIIHPPTDNKLRAYCKSDFIEKEKEYLQRNKDIVNNSDILIACPFSSEEQLRSGTWSTIRYAKKLNKTVLMYV
jgi:hypothetical protein